MLDKSQPRGPALSRYPAKISSPVTQNKTCLWYVTCTRALWEELTTAELYPGPRLSAKDVSNWACSPGLIPSLVSWTLTTVTIPDT